MQSDHAHFLRCLEALKGSSTFKQMDSISLKELLTYMRLNYWNKGIFKDNLDSQFNFIVSGRLKVYQVNHKTGREHTILLLTSGDVFDIIGLMDSEHHDVYWAAIEPLEILTLPIEQMRSWVVKNPCMHQHILSILGKRIRQLEHAKTDVSLFTVLERLAQLLVQNIDVHSRELNNIEHLPNDEIAGLIGTTGAVLNRHLQELIKCGAISLKSREIVINNIELLLSIAEGKYVP